MGSGVDVEGLEWRGVEFGRCCEWEAVVGGIWGLGGLWGRGGLGSWGFGAQGVFGGGEGWGWGLGLKGVRVGGFGVFGVRIERS